MTIEVLLGVFIGFLIAMALVALSWRAWAALDARFAAHLKEIEELRRDLSKMAEVAPSEPGDEPLAFALDGTIRTIKEIVQEEMFERAAGNAPPVDAGTVDSVMTP